MTPFNVPCCDWLVHEFVLLSHTQIWSATQTSVEVVKFENYFSNGDLSPSEANLKVSVFLT